MTTTEYTCLKCGHNNTPGASNCAACGWELILCPDCGHKIRIDQDGRCQVCGKDVLNDNKSAQEISAEPVRPVPDRSKIIGREQGTISAQSAQDFPDNDVTPDKTSVSLKKISLKRVNHIAQPPLPTCDSTEPTVGIQRQTIRLKLPEDDGSQRQYAYLTSLIYGPKFFLKDILFRVGTESKAKWGAALLILAVCVAVCSFPGYINAHLWTFALTVIGLYLGASFYYGIPGWTNESPKLLGILWLIFAAGWCILLLVFGHFAFHWILLSFISCIIIGGVLGIIRAECTIPQLALVGTVFGLIYGLARWLG